MRLLSHSEMGTLTACEAKSRYTKRGLPFWDRMTRTDSGCWEWTGSHNGRGYGQFREDKRLVYAHRRAWELTYGAIPDGLHVCHRCDSPSCCNPDHLFLGTVAENSADKVVKGRQAHIRGEQHGACKFSDAVIEQVRRLRSGGLLHREIAERTGVSESYISRILAGAR